MQVLVTLDDAVLEELLELTQETSPSRAVEVAVERLVREHKLERLRQLRGKVSMLSNDELERAYADAASELDPAWEVTTADGLADEEWS